MKTYWGMMRIRFTTGLQYRAAALGGLVTQFFWGTLLILSFAALYKSGRPQPMSFEQLSSYIWLQQAFLALLSSWTWEGEIFTAIETGGLAYELCRPADLYASWFARSVAARVSAALLRCVPILLFAAFLPAPYGLSAPHSAAALVAFMVSLVFSLLVMVAIIMICYVICCRTLSPRGVRLAFITIVGFFAGEIVPLPFFPPALRAAFELLPFGACQNMPLRIYSGNIAGSAAVYGILLQIGWLAVLAALGHRWMGRELSRVQLQGG